MHVQAGSEKKQPPLQQGIMRFRASWLLIFILFAITLSISIYGCVIGGSNSYFRYVMIAISVLMFVLIGVDVVHQYRKDNETASVTQAAFEKMIKFA